MNLFVLTANGQSNFLPFCKVISAPNLSVIQVRKSSLGWFKLNTDGLFSTRCEEPPPIVLFLLEFDKFETLSQGLSKDFSFKSFQSFMIKISFIGKGKKIVGCEFFSLYSRMPPKYWVNRDSIKNGVKC